MEKIREFKGYEVPEIIEWRTHDKSIIKNEASCNKVAGCFCDGITCPKCILNQHDLRLEYYESLHSCVKTNNLIILL